VDGEHTTDRLGRDKNTNSSPSLKQSSKDLPLSLCNFSLLPALPTGTLGSFVVLFSQRISHCAAANLHTRSCCLSFLSSLKHSLQRGGNRDFAHLQPCLVGAAHSRQAPPGQPLGGRAKVADVRSRVLVHAIITDPHEPLALQVRRRRGQASSHPRLQRRRRQRQDANQQHPQAGRTVPDAVFWLLPALAFRLLEAPGPGMRRALLEPEL
jgi:hypothetical protein